MQTILVPVDFSPASRNAAGYAARLATVLHAKLLLFHAYMLPTPVSEVPYVMITADEMQKENEALIKQDADQLHKDYGVETEWLVRIGIASDEVKVLTMERQADMVIMGMKGAGGIEKIIGSTTINVIRKVKTPVLIVPHDASFRPFTKITYASDFSYKTSAHLFDPLLALLKPFGAHVLVLNVQLQHSGLHAEGILAKDDLEKTLKDIDHQYVTIEDNSVTSGISRFIVENKSDLLVMVAHKHGFFERVFSKNHTTAMAYETHIPMLVLQDKG